MIFSSLLVLSSSRLVNVKEVEVQCKLPALPCYNVTNYKRVSVKKAACLTQCSHAFTTILKFPLPPACDHDVSISPMCLAILICGSINLQFFQFLAVNTFRYPCNLALEFIECTQACSLWVDFQHWFSYQKGKKLQIWMF